MAELSHHLFDIVAPRSRAMKELSAALLDELASEGVAKNEMVELILDGKCRAADLSCLGGMEALTKLSLCNVGLASLNGFPSLPKLTRLILADNRIADGLQNLVSAQLPVLTGISLAHNRIFDIRELEPLKHFHLTHLDLGECPIAQNTPNYRNAVLEMFPTLQVLDNLDRDGIELLDDDEEDEEEEEESDEEEDDNLEQESDEDEEVEDIEPELLNLVTDSDDDEEEQSDHEDSEPEEIHVSVLAGPPIADEKSDEDQDYVMSENESGSEEESFESDEHVSVSQHFVAAASSGAAGGSSDPSAATGTKRKRTTHGSEDLKRDIPQDEDYADI